MITYLAHSPRTSIEHVVLYKYENDVLAAFCTESKGQGKYFSEK